MPKISELPDAGAFTGNEEVVVNDAGTSKKTTTNAIKGLTVTDAASVNTDTTNFDGNLSPADDDVQKALETLDELSITGEANTASNQGTAGVGVFDNKNGVDLEFRNINAGSNKVTVTLDGANKEVDVDVAEANLDLGNMGGTVGTSQIADNAVTNAKSADMAANTFKGNNTGSSTDPVDVTVAEQRLVGRVTGGNLTDLTGTQATTILDDFVGDSGSGGTKGLVPAPATGDAADLRVLNADGTWKAPIPIFSVGNSVLAWHKLFQQVILH